MNVAETGVLKSDSGTLRSVSLSTVWEEGDDFHLKLRGM